MFRAFTLKVTLYRRLVFPPPDNPPAPPAKGPPGPPRPPPLDPPPPPPPPPWGRAVLPVSLPKPIVLLRRRLSVNCPGPVRESIGTGIAFCAGTVLNDPIPGTVTIVGPTAPFANVGR